MFTEVFWYDGLPKIDQGVLFTSRVWQAFCSRLNINAILSQLMAKPNA